VLLYTLRDPQTVHNRASEHAQKAPAKNRGKRARISRYSQGQLVDGYVTRVEPYGAFVTLDDGCTALLHISQITHTRISKDQVFEVFEKGDQVTALVLWVDLDRGRMALSTRKLEQEHGDMLRDSQLVYSTAEAMAAAFRERLQAS
jgi:small subunit ribosomal protein S1